MKRRSERVRKRIRKKKKNKSTRARWSGESARIMRFPFHWQLSVQCAVSGAVDLLVVLQ